MPVRAREVVVRGRGSCAGAPPVWALDGAACGPTTHAHGRRPSAHACLAGFPARQAIASVLGLERSDPAVRSGHLYLAWGSRHCQRRGELVSTPLVLRYAGSARPSAARSQRRKRQRLTSSSVDSRVRAACLAGGHGPDSTGSIDKMDRPVRDLPFKVYRAFGVRPVGHEGTAECFPNRIPPACPARTRTSDAAEHSSGRLELTFTSLGWLV